ncbi:Class B secretin-like G-protein coupled receptor GPRmth7, putative [Gryllus bimaculatus]|nr:Class B secretin-like G-protein coupled receptor GPRmth7, putative [Gryllus bimaculatus]
MRAFYWWLTAAAAVALCAGHAAAWPAPAGEDADLSSEDPPTPALALGELVPPATTLEPELDTLATTPGPEDNATAPEALHAGPRVLQRLENGSMPHECNGSGEFTCIPKCCPVGQTYQDTKCVPTHVQFNPFIANYSYVKDGMDFVEWPQGSFALVIGNPCKDWTYVNYTEIDMWSNGQLFLYHNQHTTDGDVLQPFEFCLEHSERDTEAIFCIGPGPSVQRGFANWLYTFGMLVSVSGLLLTLFVYLAVDALRDLHGKSLIFHVGCLAVAYSLLAAVQLSGDTNFGPFVCRRMGLSDIWVNISTVDN